MKRFFGLLTLLFTVCTYLSADCTIAGPVYSNTNPFTGCTGTITVNGDFIINNDYNISGLGDVVLIINNGTVSFSGNQDFTMNEGATFLLQGSSTIEADGSCNANKKIYLGTTKIATCNGGGGVDYSFADVTMAGGIDASGILPVNFTELSATLNNSLISVNWMTSFEYNNDYFEIEHSTDGEMFSSIGKINGNDFSDTPSYYSFVHPRPSPQNYYRIKQVDYDGKFSYSNIISQQFKKMQRFGNLFPNPSHGLASNIIVSSQKAEAIDIIFLDTSGRQIKTLKYQTVKGINYLTMSILDLNPGVYFVKMSSEDETITQKLTIRD